MGVPGRWSVLSALVVLGLSCGGSTDEPEVSESIETAGLTCADVHVAHRSGVPLDPVGLGGLTGLDAADVLLEVHTEEGAGGPVRVFDERWFTPPGRDARAGTETGRLVAVVPLHPAGNLEGGPVELRLEAGLLSCDLGEFAILPLEAAPGTTETVATALQDYVAAQAWHFGATPAALRTASVDTLMPPLVPLFLAQAVLDHPANPNSLRAVLDGDSPYFENGEADLELLDAVYARSRVRASLQSLTERIGAAGAVAARQRDEARSAFRFASAPAEGAGAQQEEWGQMLHRCPVPAQFLKPSAAQLSCWMHLAMNGDFMTSGPAKDTWDGFSMTLGVGATLPVPMYREGMVAAAAASFAFHKAAEAAANLLPRTFVAMSVDLEPAAFNEDDPGPGSFDPVLVTARSVGWNVSASAIELMAQVFRVRGAARGSSGVFQAWSNEAARKAEWLAAGGRFVAETLFKAGILPAAAEATAGTVFEIPAADFGPTDVTDEEWTEVRIEGPAVQTIGRPRYAPSEVGLSKLTVWTRELKFGDQRIQRAWDLEVKPLTVRVVPEVALIDPGASVTLRATVENANDRRVQWTVDPAGPHTLIVAGADGLTADITTSSDPDDFPALVKATSLADRSHLVKSTEAYGLARLSTGRIRLDPGFECVPPGGSATFTVVYPETTTGEIVFGGGLDTSGGRDFRWEASEGRISSRGVFTARRSTGVAEARITAVSRQDPALTAEATVRIGGCECWSWISIGHPIGRTVTGYASFMTATTGNPRDLSLAAVLQVSLTNSNVLAVARGGDPIAAAARQVQLGFSYPGFTAGNTGDFPLSVAMSTVGSVASGEAYLLGFEPGAYGYGKGSGMVHITEHTPTVLAGSFEANLMLARRRDYVSVPVRAGFRAVTGNMTDNSSDLWECMNEVPE